MNSLDLKKTIADHLRSKKIQLWADYIVDDDKGAEKAAEWLLKEWTSVNQSVVNHVRNLTDEPDTDFSIVVVGETNEVFYIRTEVFQDMIARQDAFVRATHPANGDRPKVIELHPRASVPLAPKNPGDWDVT